ncbi:MAG TPA: hypothetical protein VGC44_13600, partial [Longimicrobiales bacterium]
LAVVAGCTRVVETRTTSEIRPMRYAILEVTRAVAAQDSAIAMAKRALAAENLKLLREERATGTVEGGPVRMAAEGDQPALDATVTITANAQGPATRFRIYASAVLAAGAVGGVDPRLTALVQRVSQGIR